MSKPARSLAPAAVALALALTAPSALARPAVDAPAQVATPIATTYLASTAASPSASGSTFEWGSAAIGAGGVLLLVLLITAGIVVAGRARVRTVR